MNQMDIVITFKNKQQIYLQTPAGSVHPSRPLRRQEHIPPGGELKGEEGGGMGFGMNVIGLIVLW